MTVYAVAWSLLAFSTLHRVFSIAKVKVNPYDGDNIDFQTRLRKDYPTWPFDMSLSQQIGLGVVLTLLPAILNIVCQISNP